MNAPAERNDLTKIGGGAEILFDRVRN